MPVNKKTTTKKDTVNVTKDTTTTTTTVDNTEVTETIEKKTFKPSDLISTTSLYAGEMGMIGKKTGILYVWNELGVSTDIEYQDIMSEILSKNSSYIYTPLIMVNDEDLVNQRTELQAIYDRIYSPNELSEILNLPASDMENTINNLPKGVKDSIKILASTKIQNGTLDSVQKIKILDRIFNTKLMLQTELFSQE